MIFNRKEYFEKQVNKWIDFFDLRSFEVYIFEENNQDNKATCYQNSIDVGGQIASIVYNKEWIGKADRPEISKVAFHEVMELLLFELRLMSGNHDLHISKREVDKEIHRVIRILESKIYDKIR